MSHKFSKTQIEDYRLCARKWAWRTIEKVRGEKSRSAQLGIDVHGILERWLRDGAPIDMTSDAGEIAMSMIPHLPPPKTVGMLVEHRFEVEMGGHLFVGVADVEIMGTTTPTIMDHKTTSDFKWACSAEDLRAKDIQAAIYAGYAMHKYSTDSCHTQWTYGKTSGSRKALPVLATLARRDVEGTLEKVIETAGEMAGVLAASPRALDLIPSPDACDAFGGCEFVDRCQLTANQKVKAFMSQAEKANNVLTMLRQRQAGKINSDPVPAVQEVKVEAPVQVPLGAASLPTTAVVPVAEPLPARRNTKLAEAKQETPTSRPSVDVLPLLRAFGALFSEIGRVLQEVSK